MPPSILKKLYDLLNFTGERRNRHFLLLIISLFVATVTVDPPHGQHRWKSYV